MIEYKSTIDALTGELDALGGTSRRRGYSWEELFETVERERASRLQLEQGVHHFCIDEEHFTDPGPALEEAGAQSLAQSEEIEKLEQNLFDLGGEIAAGQHVPPGVRVLSLRDNPEQAWVDLRQSAMDRLRGENEALLKRLKELEAVATSSGASVSAMDGEELVPRESWELVNKEKKELEELVKQKEKRLKRLQEVCYLSVRTCFCLAQVLKFV